MKQLLKAGSSHDAVEARAERNQIPALLEELHAIGMDVECVTLFAPIALVGDAKLGVGLHRFEDERQGVLSRWNILEEDAVLDGLAVQQQVADGDGLEQPAAKAAAPDFLYIIYIIMVAAFALTFDDEVEHVFGCNLPFVEGADGDGLRVHLLVEPLLVDFLEGDSSGPVDGVHEPNIFVDKVLCHSKNR